MVCVGDIETGGVICSCSSLWDCSLNPNKCQQDVPTPDGGSGWDCTWTEFKYSCKKEGSENEPPAVPGGSGWTCSWNGEHWECNKDFPPNPSNKPDGTTVWTCEIVDDKLVCDREENPGTEPPPTGAGVWNCEEKNGKVVCTKEDDNGGLPPGGSNWTCNQANIGGKLVWVCYGEVPEGGQPPGGSGWDCVLVKTEMGKDIYKCIKPDEPSDKPPGGGDYACSKGSEFNGTTCEKVDQPPTPPGPYPKPGEICIPGTKMWCDGLQYCGWGQVTCLPDGSWPTKIVNGKKVLDCQELGNGARPKTVCACYHFYFNPACCERPDCIVPEGSQGQVCAKSQGGLCDYCNPQNPECVENGGYCLVTNTMETFCGKGCTADTDCPNGYKCLVIKNKPNKQCIPADFSCYY